MAVEDVAAADTSLDTAMESFFAPASSGAPPSAEVPAAPSAPAEEGSAAAAPAEQVAEPPAGEQPPEETPPALPEDEDVAPIDTTGKKAIQIDTSRWDRVYQGYKLAQGIRDFAPSVEAAKAHYETANDYRAMHADFRSADPANMGPFLDHWANESPEGFAVMAQQLPERLATLAPEAFQAVQTQFLGQKVEQLYQEAAESGNPQDLYHAQLLDFKLTGKYRQAGEVKKPDPVAQRQAELDKREATLTQREGARQQAVWHGVVGRIDKAKAQGLNTEIDRVLAPAKPQYEKQPEVFEALRDRIKTKVEAAIKADFEWGRNYDIDFRAIEQAFVRAFKTGAKTSGLNAEVQALVDSYAAKARGIVGSVARPLVNQATARLLEESAARHGQLNKSQDRRGTSGGGAPTGKSFAPNLPANASLDDKMDAFFRQR